MIRAQAGQSVGAQMLNASTGAAFSGAVTVYVTKDAGIQTIGSVGGGACTHEGNGFFSYLPAAAECDGAICAFTFIGTGAIPTTIQYPTITIAQQAALIASTVSGAVSVLEICESAALEHNIVLSGETLSANDGAVILGRLNRLLDQWNAKREAVYSVSFDDYTLTPNLSPHTIGPSSATFTAAQRPQTIDGASLILTTGSYPVHVPITVRTATWWDAQTVPGIATAYPTDVYYNPTWPNGQLYFWPIPTTAYQVELYTRQVLSQVTLADVVTFPPGYRAAIELTLAELIARPFSRQNDPDLQRMARDARATIFRANPYTPPYQTRDAGMPSGASPSTASYLNPYLPPN